MTGVCGGHVKKEKGEYFTFSVWVHLVIFGFKSENVPFFLQMSEDNDVELDLTGYQYGWTCAICLRPAINGVFLEFQWIDDTLPSPYVFRDLGSDFQWVRCPVCLHSFHLHCVTDLDAWMVNIFGFVCCQF